mmetsp:Transcript_84058/g.154193  ORF Transcript_84058/g.154193 Transcript_84058/m.154193 type:complete len:99 (-) Transcript_84058:130-426(-)
MRHFVRPILSGELLLSSTTNRQNQKVMYRATMDRFRLSWRSLDPCMELTFLLTTSLLHLQQQPFLAVLVVGFGASSATVSKPLAAAGVASAPGRPVVP